MNLSRVAARGSGVTLSAQGVRLVMQFATTILLARLLTPTDFGLVAMVSAIVSVAEVVRDFGLSSAAIQAKHVSDDERTNLFWANMVLGVVCALLMAALAPVIVLIYHDDRLYLIVFALSSSFILSGANTQFKADLTRRLRFRNLAIIDVLCVLAGAVAGVAVAMDGWGYWAIVAQQLVTTFVSLVLCVIASHWLPGLPRRHVSIRRFVHFGLGLFGTQLISYVTKNVDDISLGAVWGASPVGLYDRAYQLLMTPLNQINAPMTRIALPILSRIRDDRPRFQRYLLRAQLVGAYVTATAFAVSAGLSVPLVAVLFGPRWSAVVPIFVALAVGGMFRAIAQISYWIYLADGKTGAQLRMFLATRPIMVVIILAGLPWGAIGVAIGSTVAYTLHWAVSLWRAGAVTKVPVRPLFANALRIVAAISIPCGAAAWSATLLPLPAALQLVVGLAFAGAWVALAALILPFVRRDLSVIWKFGKDMISRRGRR